MQKSLSDENKPQQKHHIRTVCNKPLGAQAGLTSTLSQILLRFINIFKLFCLRGGLLTYHCIIMGKYESRINTEMNQRCEPDSKTNTQPRRDRPKTKRQAPTNLIKSFQSEPSFSLKPELPASNRRGKRNSDQTNHHSGSLSHKTSYICSIHNK